MKANLCKCGHVKEAHMDSMGRMDCWCRQAGCKCQQWKPSTPKRNVIAHQLDGVAICKCCFCRKDYANICPVCREKEMKAKRQVVTLTKTMAIAIEHWWETGNYKRGLDDGINSIRRQLKAMEK